MAVTMKNAVFWDVTPCGSCKKKKYYMREGALVWDTRVRVKKG
jgi:hypothetical protein